MIAASLRCGALTTHVSRVLYVATAAALLAQLLIEQGASLGSACVAAALLTLIGARVVLVPLRLAVVVVAALSALVAAVLGARIAPPADAAHVLALLGAEERTASALSLVADVVEPPRLREHGVSAVLEARTLERVDGPQPVWGRVNLFVREVSGRLHLGDRLRLRARLSRVANFHNPGEFDYARWCARRGIYVSAFVWDDRDVTVLGASPDLGIVDRTRARIAAAAIGARGVAGAMTAALVVGDGSALPTDVMEQVRISGLSHLLAISGMNIGLVAAVALWLCRSLLAWTPLPASGRDPLRPAAVVAALAVLGYSALSGGGESVVRSAVMSLLMLAAVWHGRAGDALRAMALAALFLCILAPGSVAEAGFQLSFAATAAIIAFADTMRRVRAPAPARALVVAISIGILCWTVTAPILAHHFARISLMAPLAGLAAALPSAVVVVAGLAGSAFLAISTQASQLAFDIAALGGWGILTTARLGAMPAWAEQCVVCPDGLTAASLALLPVLPAFARDRRRRVAVATVVLIAVGAGRMAFDRYRDDRADVVFVSVGQGDATIARLPGGRVLVVDGGPPGRGRSVVGPLLRRMGIARIDYLIATHVQDDHWGGLPELAGDFEVGELWHPGGRCDVRRFLAFTASLERRGVQVVDVGAELARRSAAGKTFPALRRRGSEGWRLRAVWPRTRDGACDDNDRSVAVILQFGRVRILLTGDLESPAEREMARQPHRLRAGVLKAPHHGSRTSSSSTLLDAVMPTIAVASSGVHNRYGFPHPEVIARYAARRVPLYRTDEDGAVQMHAYRKAVVVETSTGRSAEKFVVGGRGSVFGSALTKRRVHQ